MRRVRVRVRGVVQGVGFRYRTRSMARSLGVGGFVRNLEDGSVEAVFEGPEEAVASLVAWCGRGPRGARVEDISVEEEQPVGEDGFAAG